MQQVAPDAVSLRYMVHPMPFIRDTLDEVAPDNFRPIGHPDRRASVFFRSLLIDGTFWNISVSSLNGVLDPKIKPF